MRYFLELSYKGTHYHGWQIQPNAITVQEVIENALGLLLRSETKITGAGRTDTGVHAQQMFAHFDTGQGLDTQKLTYKLNALLPQDIAIKRIIPVNDEAHARFDAVSRSYKYYIHRYKNPFVINNSWYFAKDLDIVAMNMAAKSLLNFKDFKSFSKTHTDVKTYICDIRYASWETKDNQLVFSIIADRFLRNMVRAIVGTLVEVGLDKISPADFIKIIEARDRQKAGFSVPAHGLFLTGITYPEQTFLDYGND